MDPLTYLTTFSTGFGALEWVFFIAQIAVAGAGAYLAFFRTQTHPIRRSAQTLLGNSLLALGVVGVLIGLLRLTGVSIFTMPIWFAIVTALDVVLIVAAIYYRLAVYPPRLAAYEEANRSRGGRRSARQQPALQVNAGSGSNGAAFEAPRMGPPSPRREARRDRKRKSR